MFLIAPLQCLCLRFSCVRDGLQGHLLAYFGQGGYARGAAQGSEKGRVAAADVHWVLEAGAEATFKALLDDAKIEP